MIRVLTMLVFAVLLSAASNSSTAGDSEVTYADVCAGYDQNLRSLGAFRVEVRVKQSSTLDHLDVLQSRLSRLERIANKGSSDSQHEVKEIISRLKDDILVIGVDQPGKLPKVHEQTAALTVSGESLQVVVSFVNPQAVYPIASIRTSADLSSSYLDRVVLSWSQLQRPHTWIWKGNFGRADHIQMNASLTDKQPCEALTFPVPPIGRVSEVAINSGSISILDQPFQGDPGGSSVLGRETLNGTHAVVIECRSDAGRGKLFFLKTWVDPQRGFIPIRLERSLFVPSPGGGEGQRSVPYQIVKVSEVRKIGDSTYYPVSWTIETLQSDDRSPESRLAVGSKHVPYIYQTESWMIDSISVNLEEPKLLSEVGFPVKTYCYDETKNEYFTVGSVEAAVDATIASVPKVVSDLPGPPKVLQPASTRWKLFLLVNVLVTVGLAAFATVRLYRRNLQERGAK